ncbi:hypothetical protein [Mucilaginibacter polytrichastri]|uniref:Uncharacterized protein n=1 Tax=Mucilaginibacter polytrichastri TaxID=1302689 RepID=A0A1Q5ZS02_9SPHI|nr:hypothetical protein [Mucilaginibacter polytrichastri]OKS84551.1 hypothetical protein RG47T_5241 [Mucilaginibacter polytrichastri]SFT23914.1 hypothetical protein SAMN04487890_12155 [Mucilaginibacter polytrichastri]
MNPIACFWIVFVVILLALVLLEVKYHLLKDIGRPPATTPEDAVPNKKDVTYSWSRVQLAWWTLIILSAFTTILLIDREAPDLATSTLILIGISTATIATARSIDVNDQDKLQKLPGQNSQGLLIDILSDQTGVSIPRFQNVVFNVIFGIWFVGEVLHHLVQLPGGGINAIMPDISTNNLILLGLSSATYAALKTTENNSATK